MEEDPVTEKNMLIEEMKSSQEFERLKSDFEMRLVEQEHRVFSVASNFWRYRSGPEILRKASLSAVTSLVIRLLFAGGIVGGFSIVAILGLVVAIRSNDILEQQNLRLDQQNLLVEAQRRSSLNVELSSLWDQLRDEVPPGARTTAFQPSDVLAARVVVLTRAFTPYFYLEHNQGLSNSDTIDADFFRRVLPLEGERRLVMRETALSPERGHLLIALTSVGADVSFISARGATFAYSDLRGQILSFPKTYLFDLTGANFSGSILWRTDFSGSTLTNASFDCSYFEHVVFGFGGSPFFAENATFRYVDLGEFIVSRHQLPEKAPSTYFFHDAIFQDIDLSDSFLGGLTFSGYESTDDLPLPESFDRRRYGLERAEGGFVVVVNDPSIEAQERQAAREHCIDYYNLPDPRLARVMWGGILDGEWKHW
ncbi:pentapeptide repeat-containing protein [Paracoccaceae bacterium GXU_MW_L88]